MLFIREFTVRKHERGILFRNGDFERFLAPAVYRFFDPQKRLTVERFDLAQPAFEHRLLDYLVRWQPEAVEDLFLRVETGTGQIAVIYRNGHPWTFVAPECRALFWKGVVHVRAELIDVATAVVVPRRLAQSCITQRRARGSSAFDAAVLVREVPEAHVGLLFVDGRLVQELPPGVHAFWKIGRNVSVPLVNLRALLEHKGSLDRDAYARVHDRLAALGIDLKEIGVNELARIAL